MADQEKKAPEKEPRYYVKNMVRRAQTRAARHRMAGRASFTQRILDNRVRLSRGKFHQISKEQLEKYWDELNKKQNDGLIRVCVGHPKGPAFGFGERGASPAPVEVKDDDSKDEEEAAAAPAEEVEDTSSEEGVGPEGEPDLDKMRKSDLIKYASKVLGEEEGVLERMTKSEIKELLS